MSTSGALSTRRLRAPSESGHAFLDPPRAAIAECIERNRADASRRDAACGDGTFGDLARSARRELLRMAWQYTSEYRDAGAAPAWDQDPTVIVTGHQPQLFHAGVWHKNFLLAELGTAHRAACVNLLIDNDTSRSAAIRVPTGSLDAPRIVSVPYDSASVGVPHEERMIRDRQVFETFATRASETLLPFTDQWHALGKPPLVTELWNHAQRALKTNDNLGQVVAQARNCLEADWGLNNWELPLSDVCRTRSFRTFLLHLLVHADPFRDAYNRCLGEYRQANRIRSRSHPVPALVQEGGWCETPFWIWYRERPQRSRLFVRTTNKGLELTDRQGMRHILPLRGEGQLAEAVEQLGEWEGGGIRIRPRALMTTMYARVVLSDLFVHGIGGAKYDELTDEILRAFLGIVPPHYVVATATLRLPYGLTSLDARQRLRQIDRQFRELQFHPEKFLPLTPDIRPLVEAKREWIGKMLPPGQRKQRHDAIRAMNEALQPYVRDHRDACLRDRRGMEWEMRRERLLGSREFSFCLFPADGLRRTLLELSRQEP